MNAANLINRLTIGDEEHNINLFYAVIQDDPFILDNMDSEQFVETPLHIAASRGHVRFAIEVMNLKPSFSWKLNRQGFSPLHLAINAMQNGKKRLVLCFIVMNKDHIRVKGRGGMTPLHLAAESGEVDLLAEFLTACPDSIEDVTVRGETALHIAVNNNQYEALRLLVCFLKKNTKRGARKLEHKILNLKDESDNTILHTLVQRDFMPQVTHAVQLLLKRRINMNAKNLEDNTALDVAILPEIQRILIHAGARLGANVADAPTLADKLRSHTTIIGNLLIWMRSIRRDISEEQRNTWLIIATLVATATYQSVLSPPGGFYQANATDENLNTTSSNSTATTNTGKSVLSRNDFIVFSHLNVFSFIVSTMAILILSPWGVVGTLVFGPVVWFAVSYLYSMWVISPTTFNTIIDRIFLILIGLVVVILSIITVYSKLKRQLNAERRNRP